MPESQSDSTQVTVVPDTLVTTSPDTSSSQYPGSAAWQDSMKKAQTLEEPSHFVPQIFQLFDAVRDVIRGIREWWSSDDTEDT